MKRVAPDWAWRASLDVISTVPEISACRAVAALDSPAAVGWPLLEPFVDGLRMPRAVVSATVITRGLSKASARSAIWSPEAWVGPSAVELAAMGAADAT